MNGSTPRAALAAVLMAIRTVQQQNLQQIEDIRATRGDISDLRKEMPQLFVPRNELDQRFGALAQRVGATEDAIKRLGEESSAGMIRTQTIAIGGLTGLVTIIVTFLMNHKP